LQSARRFGKENLLMLSSFNFITKTFILFGVLLIFSNLPANAFPHFDGDNKADLAVFRPSDQNWHSLSSENQNHSAARWGLATDYLVPGDYDGDRITDYAVWRQQTGDWFVLRSTDKRLFSINWGGMPPPPPPRVISFLSPDIPVVGDYDGDGTTDFAVWRPDTGMWHVLKSTTGFSANSAQIFQWGALGDVPVPADYDGDGKTDFAVFRPGQNRWYIFQSGGGSWKTSNLGNPGSDLLVPADYTGDGKTDVAVYRGGVWIVQRSENGQLEFYSFGLNTDMPVPADYDGDKRADIAVFRRGTWFVRQSSNGQMSVSNFGLGGDIPLASLAVKETVVAIP
jgi:hypothetical protein